MTDQDDPRPKPPGARAQRRPYRTPRLERLGTLTEITAAVGSSGKNDHAGPPVRKTS